MGGSMKKISSYFSKQDQARILMCGLDAAGKTTVLYVLKLGEVVTTIPTIGFNVETVTYGNIDLTTWDVGGRDKIRPLWRHYYANTSALIFVVDSNDRERMDEACEELHRMTNEEELKNCPILIFANKQDLPNVVTLDELKEKLNLSKLDKMNVKWHLQPAVAPQNKGLHEGFEWLATTLKSSKTTNHLAEPILETIDDSKIMKDNLMNLWKSNGLKGLLSKFI